MERDGQTKRVSKKEVIDRAAMELFAGQGFAGTTIKDIAKKAGVTEGALYRHYAGKEEMAAILFERELADIRQRLTESLAGGRTPYEKLRAVIAYLYTSYRDEPWPLLFVILNFQNLQGDSVLDEKKHIYDYIIEYTRQLFDGLPGPRDHEFLSTLITGLVIQPIIFHHYQKLPRHPAEYIDEICRGCCLLTGLEP